ncbi:MAG: hypothetical protein SGJ27_01880 [Candidatus Melainabacteria bacterium]|nr:hypothetical protein [Candidatus Melainabacteria bacterium]
MKNSMPLYAMVLSLIIGTLCAENAFGKRIETVKSTAPDKARDAKDLWVASQMTDEGTPYTVCVNPTAFKFVKGHLVVIAKQPDWKVTLLNQRARTFATVPLEEFKGLASISKFNVKKLEPIATKPAEQKIAEQPVTVSEGDCQFSESAIKSLGFAPEKVKLLSTNKVPAPDGALKVLGRILGVESLEGIPLAVKVTKKDGEVIDCLRTQWCLTREPDAQGFEIPKAFSPGKSFNDVETQTNVVSGRSMVRKHLVREKN